MGAWRFDLGNLMAHGCGKGKIATIKSRWDRTCGDLTIWPGKSMAPVVSHRGGAWNCSPPQLHCSERSGRWAVANAGPGRHNGETHRETQQENYVKREKAEKRPLKEDEIGLVWIWPGKSSGAWCGKGKITTTKSRLDRTCGDLTSKV